MARTAERGPLLWRARALAAGAAAGAGAMYLLDPDRGRRRRALVRDAVTKARRRSLRGLDAAARDVRNRARGRVARARGRLRREPVPDEVLAERVRAALGRLVSHPGSVEVSVEDACAALRGPVLASERRRLLAGVARVPGVRAVDDSGLDSHDGPGSVPGLQGEPPRRGRGLRQRNWPPAQRAAVTACGGALVVRGLRDRGPVGFLSAAAGAGLAARAVSNVDLRRLVEAARAGRGEAGADEDGGVAD